MGNNCLNCSTAATDRYTLILDTGKTLEEKVLCDGCVSEFRRVEWLEVHDAPVLLHGGDGERKRDETQP